MPGAALEGSNPLQTNNGGTATESTMSTANGGDKEMVTTQVSSFPVAEPVGGGSAAKAQMVEMKKDTTVQATDVNKVKNLTEQRRKYGQQTVDEIDRN